MICVGVLVAYCFAATPTVSDSFCQVYQQVVAAKGGGMISAAPGVKRRLLANELTYRKLCRSR